MLGLSFISPGARSAAHPALLRRAALVFVLGGMVILMAACLPLPEEPSADGAESAAAMDATEEAPVEQARADLAAQLGVDADAIEVTSIEAVEWGDSSLGCPEEGMMYAAVITPGYRITLTHDGEEYVYHTGADADGPLINCTEGEETSVPAGDTEEKAPMSTIRDTLIAQAKEDLAQRQGVETSEIEVKSVQAVEWRDGSLGCATPGMMYPQVITPGYRITLSVDGVDYAYHTGRRKGGPVKYCDAGQKSKVGDGTYRTG